MSPLVETLRLSIASSSFISTARPPEIRLNSTQTLPLYPITAHPRYSSVVISHYNQKPDKPKMGKTD